MRKLDAMRKTPRTTVAKWALVWRPIKIVFLTCVLLRAFVSRIAE